MQHFYDGQIRRYLTQVIRLFSNFVVKYGDGTLVRVPVMYGDADRQAATIVNQNSENVMLSSPRIAVYINDLDLSRERLGDSTYVGKLNIRERDIDDDTGQYTNLQGNNYTVERLMPTPFDLSFKVDIWSSSTDQKLQILEQILTLFNPSLEIQTTDNYIDWTSLSVVDLQDITFSSRSVPVGTNSTIDIATLTLKTPIYLSPPAKIKKLGIITNIIANIYNNQSDSIPDYIDGLGNDQFAGQVVPVNFLAETGSSISNFDIFVEGTSIKITSNTVGSSSWLLWETVINQYPGKFIAGLSKIFLRQSTGNDVVGTLTLNPLDPIVMSATWDPDTFPSNTSITGPTRNQADWAYFDAIIDPTTFNPKRPNKERTNQLIEPGTRYLIVDSIGGAVRDTFESTVKTTFIHTNVLHKKVNNYTLYVNGVEVISDPQPNPIFYGTASVTISGVGSGATFNVTQVLSTATYSATIASQGVNYQAGDIIRVRGKKLGGVNIVNDCVITVLTVNASGNITSIRVTGSSIDKMFVIVTADVIQISTDLNPVVVSYEINVNEDGPDAWKNTDNSDALAEANDIVEWDGSKWVVIFSASENTEAVVYQTNFYTRTQYKWNGVDWAKSFEGEYKRGQWRIIL